MCLAALGLSVGAGHWKRHTTPMWWSWLLFAVPLEVMIVPVFVQVLVFVMA